LTTWKKALAFLEFWRDPARGRARLRDAITAARQAGENWCLCDALEVVAAAYLAQDDFAAALGAVEKAAPVADRLDSPFLLAWVADLRAAAALQPRDISAAADLSHRALDYARAIDEPSTLMYAHGAGAMALISSGGHEQAREELEGVLSWLRERPSLLAQLNIESELAYAELMCGEIDAAVARLGIADQVQHIGIAAMAAFALSYLAEALLAGGDRNRARTSLDDALAIT
jgi:ATP/maltotriose-dependent transcriptional regulator MalT